MIAVLVFNTAGYLLFYSVSDFMNYQKQIAMFDADHLQWIRIEKNKNVFRDGEHEIVVNGNRYDVKQHFTKGDFTYYYCLRDKTEELITDGFKQAVQNQNDSQSGTTSNTVPDVFKLLVKECLMEGDGIMCNENSCFHFHPWFSNHYLSATCIQVIAPPPKG